MNIYYIKKRQIHNILSIILISHFLYTRLDLIFSLSMFEEMLMCNDLHLVANNEGLIILKLPKKKDKNLWIEIFEENSVNVILTNGFIIILCNNEKMNELLNIFKQRQF